MNPAQESLHSFHQFWLEWQWVILLATGSTVAIAIAIVLLIQTAQTSTPIEFVGGSTLGVDSEQGIYVDIEGSVLNPGAKRLPVGSRVEDALKAAGGLTDSADTEYAAKVLNRAQPISDGMKLYIPSKEEYETSHNTDLQDKESKTSYNISTDSNNQDGQVGPLISINSATGAELDTLAGVGPITAQKIISNRPYKTLDDLVNKKVIGVSLFQKVKFRLAL